MGRESRGGLSQRFCAQPTPQEAGAGCRLLPRSSMRGEVLEGLSSRTGHDAALTTLLPLVKALNPFGVQIRYPGMSATVTEAKDALKTVRRLRTVLRRALGL